MGKFKFTDTGIEGMFIVEPTVFEDNRGYFMETYNENDFKDAGYDLTFVQDNQSKSSKGVLRGRGARRFRRRRELVSCSPRRSRKTQDFTFSRRTRRLRTGWTRFLRGQRELGICRLKSGTYQRANGGELWSYCPKMRYLR